MSLCTDTTLSCFHDDLSYERQCYLCDRASVGFGNPASNEFTASVFGRGSETPTNSRSNLFIKLELTSGPTWGDVFRSAGWDCRCPDTTKVWQMPRELHPYQWVDNKKPIIIPDSVYQQWVKADEAFKKNYRRADSLMRAKQNPKPIQ